MGDAKERSLEELAKRDIALDLAITARVISRCPVHDDSTFLGHQDIEHAYRLGSTLFKKGELNLFKNQREVTDTIKAVVEELSLQECPYCSQQG